MPKCKVVVIEYRTVIERLRHHRERLGYDKATVKRLIAERYNGKRWSELTDDEIIDFGKFLASL